MINNFLSLLGYKSSYTFDLNNVNETSFTMLKRITTLLPE